MVQAFGLVTIGLAIASLAASVSGVWLSIRLAHRVGFLDVPNERSSHAAPTPRMGGVPMVFAVVLTVGCWILFGAGATFSIPGLFLAILFAVSMAALGFWDDLSNLSPMFRFLVQFPTAIFILWILAAYSPEIAIHGVAIPKVAYIAVGAVWAIWMLNLYNFMDGIDGLAGGESVVASLFFFLLFERYGESGWATANLFIAAASMGFLIHNWPPAKVFMGDTGSAFLGAFFGMQSVIAAITTAVPFPVLVLPFTNFILDTTSTLIRRIWRGETWYMAHRGHYYQRMTNMEMSHRKVTVLELMTVAASCVAAAAYVRVEFIERVVLIAIVLGGFIGFGTWVNKKCARPQVHPEG